MWDEESTNQGRSSAGSEVVIINDQGPAAVAAANGVGPPPGRLYTISNMNLTNSPGARIGDNFVTVTNINQTDEVVKGRFLGLELISPVRARRLRCSVAVFVCWALVVASGLAIYFFCFAFSKDRIDIGLNETWYLRRYDWQAQPPSSIYNMMFLKLPVNTVMIGHSAEACCKDKYNCIKSVKGIQNDHMQRYFGDIGPNFLIGGDDGFVFEGAGANVVGTTTAGDDFSQVSIMFLGDYNFDYPTPAQFDHLAVLLDILVKESVLDKNYTMLAYCQIRTSTESPGVNIVKKLHKFSHWQEGKAYETCLHLKKKISTQARPEFMTIII